MRDAAARAFDAVEQLSSAYGVRALIETHMQTIVPSPSAAAAFLADRDPARVGVIFDPGNMVFEGHEPYRMAVEVDEQVVFAALKAVGYEGWMSFEDFTTDQPLYERTRDNIRYAREVLARMD